MGLITPMNPYTGRADLVDKTIGDAYDVCKYLYDNMEAVYAVASAIQASTVGQPLLAQRGILENGETGTAGQTTIIEFTDPEINYTKIIGSHVCVIGASGDRFYGDSGWFTSKVTVTGLSLKLAANAPADIQTALVEWFIIYGE